MPDVKKNTVSVELTHSQMVTLIDFIESNIYAEIRNNTNLDTFSWLLEMVNTHQALMKVRHNQC